MGCGPRTLPGPLLAADRPTPTLALATCGDKLACCMSAASSRQLQLLTPHWAGRSSSGTRNKTPGAARSPQPTRALRTPDDLLLNPKLELGCRMPYALALALASRSNQLARNLVHVQYTYTRLIAFGLWAFGRPAAGAEAEPPPHGATAASVICRYK